MIPWSVKTPIAACAGLRCAQYWWFERLTGYTRYRSPTEARRCAGSAHDLLRRPETAAVKTPRPARCPTLAAPRTVHLEQCACPAPRSHRRSAPTLHGRNPLRRWGRSRKIRRSRRNEARYPVPARGLPDSTTSNRLRRSVSDQVAVAAVSRIRSIIARNPLERCADRWSVNPSRANSARASTLPTSDKGRSL